MGDAFGQTRGTGALSPGLDFAFGLIDDDYIGKARDNNWLLMNDSVATPAVTNRTDSAIRMKLTVTPKEPLDNKGWYKTAQCVARALMMVRSASISYRDQYAMALPGFMPTVGDAFGQTRGTGALSPGLDFAFWSY